MRWILLGFVWLYSRLISPIWHALMGPQAGCRFTPNCAQYAAEAVREWGAFRGSLLALKRVCRCHPWSKGGLDEVPRRIP